MAVHLRIIYPLTVNLMEFESRLKIIYLILYSSLFIFLFADTLFTSKSSRDFIFAFIRKLSTHSYKSSYKLKLA
jgi:hypothetical protein